MWKVLPKFLLIKIIFVAFSGLFVSALIVKNINVSSFDSLQKALELATTCTLVFIAFLFVLAKWLWKPFWRIPKLGEVLNRHVCPDLNGEWSGTVISNFPQVGTTSTTPVKMTIKADFLGFSITLIAANGYSKSTVVQSELHKDIRTGIYYLSYLFEAQVPIPQSTDDRVFDGAARLEVLFLDHHEIQLKGTYWTNRAWQRNLNTAGIIELTR